jgi:hypothetical protein
VVTSNCIYNIKHVTDGRIDMYRDRFVAIGLSHQEREYYDKTLPQVSIRSIHRLATRYMRRIFKFAN